MFDLLFVVIVGLSTAFAAMRGGLRELSTLLALGVAGGLTLVFAEPLLAAMGLAGKFFGTVVIAAALVAILFVVIHVAFHFGLRYVPLQGRAALADRIGGGAFGLARGLILVGLFYLGYSYYLDEARQPDDVKNAFTRPVAAGMANWFESFAPQEAYIENEVEVGPNSGAGSENAALQGYERADRNGLSEIVTTVTTTDPEIEAVLAADEDGAFGEQTGETAADDGELAEDDPMAEILRRGEEEE